MAMIYDIFSYNGEKDTLDLRLNILNEYVDKFVICEAIDTFSGLPKPLFYEKHKESFNHWSDKIIYHVIRPPYDERYVAMADESPGVPKGAPHWHREFCQKESIKDAIKGLKDDDICFVSDVDEIWNPHILESSFDFKNVYKLKQRVYAYFLNNSSSEQWAGTYVTSYKNIRDGCLNHLRTRYPWIQMENGGWHFTNMGGPNEIRRKLESYGHQEYNTQNIKDMIDVNIELNRDFIGRNFAFNKDESFWPEYLIKNKDKYNHLCR